MYSKSKNTKSVVVKKSSHVTVALQLVSGQRLVHDFLPDCSLWNALEYWENQAQLAPGDGGIPVCIYLRKEVAGREELMKTTLAGLGIDSGKVIIRYICRSSDAPREQAHVGGILAPVPRPPTPERSHFVEAGATNTPERKEEMKAEEKEDVNHMEIDHSPPNTLITTGEGIGTVTKSLQQDEADDLHPDSAEETELTAHPSPEADSSEMLDVAESYFVTFLDAKGVLIYDANERKESVASTTSDRDLPDDFFELTTDELRRRMKELRQECAALEDAPLLTEKLRSSKKEQNEKGLLSKYPVTILRVQFPNGIVLQIPSPSDVLLSDIKRDILVYLDGELQMEDFYLYSAPPKVILETGVSLISSGLTPSSNVYIGTNKTHSCQLKPAFVEKMSSFAGAMQDAAWRMSGLPDRVARQVVDDNSVCSKSGGPMSNPGLHDREPTRPVKRSTTSSNNVPKWFKVKH